MTEEDLSQELFLRWPDCIQPLFMDLDEEELTVLSEITHP